MEEHSQEEIYVHAFVWVPSDILSPTAAHLIRLTLSLCSPHVGGASWEKMTNPRLLQPRWT